MVTGGAGYVGSFIVRALLRTGHEPIVYDSLEEGHRSAVLDAQLVRGDLADRNGTYRCLRRYGIDSVIHMAAYCLVGESERAPLKYFQNNVSNGLNLLAAMLEAGVRVMVFSSSAAVYGEPSSVPIDEGTTPYPTNVYGETKLYYERILEKCRRAYGLRYVSLRYFNAAGADREGDMGEDHRQETHLIPLVLRAALNQKAILRVFGTDYPTPDGTCIRDYVHVEDLADAHILALEALQGGLRSTVYNLGNGTGYSVMEVINTARSITGKDIPWIRSERRPGDPAVLVASCERIKKDLGWRVRFPRLEEIIRTAWAWHSTHPNGYADR
ncbi:MAG: UDP-glucose 4-epimerase GalE [Deltaproteobacteria bacterium]|nr:UDP-glucose 4-epimerase GalE [Deltaproteobacteria bacterium]MBW2123789.1 UDP-glucose 4-epimerase GalE [Deltaproteobacteria bacterium]